MPMRQVGEKRTETGKRPGGSRGGAGEPQIDREQPDAERAPGYGSGAYLAAEEPIAEQRAERDPDRKDRQEQGHDDFFAAERKADIARKLRQVRGADEPKPRDAEDRTKRHNIAGRLPDDLRGRSDEIPARAGIGCGGARLPDRQARGP